jgi:hypothetical protein
VWSFRQAESSGGLVSVHIPNVLCQAERELLDMVIVAADHMNHVEIAGKIPAGIRVS